MLLLILAASLATAGDDSCCAIHRITPEAGDAFYWPYYLYVPSDPLNGFDSAAILVEPNNTGYIDDDFRVHDSASFRRIRLDRDRADKWGMILLRPCFPRPKTDWQIYTQALDRDVLTCDDTTLARLDIQLQAMIADARKRLVSDSIPVCDKVLMYGFSAAGMFVNRFVLLHPQTVAAAAIGSPGGWPIAPITEYEGKLLRFPVGRADLDSLTGQPFDLLQYRQVPQLLFFGDQDDNDAVMYDDGFDEQDRELVLALFGPTPIARWDKARNIYTEVGCHAEFRLYPGVGHEVNSAMWKDIGAFLGDHRPGSNNNTD
ncbi:MAG TPA: hypothetical protein PLF13_02720 [candidate division Zixibacteria bacterium]|nr:hypothetical protein [candidate division Zixibacteria bacterium]